MTGLSIDGRTKIYGVIGNPVEHSFSPGMHTIALQELGINAVYLPFLISEDQLPHLLDAFSLTRVQGFNITLPFKEKIIPFLDSLSEEAKMLQSVNTVKKTDGGWRGYNTDGSGFIRSLAASDISVSGKNILIMGAGGAAKSIAISIAMAGAYEITILNRTQDKANALATMISQISSSTQVSTSTPRAHKIDIAINATSMGMKDDRSPLADDLIKRSKQIIDIIYNPAQTTLLKKAAALSIPCMNGMDMLLYQGVEAFEIWTDQKAPAELMRKSLMASVYPR